MSTSGQLEVLTYAGDATWNDARGRRMLRYFMIGQLATMVCLAGLALAMLRNSWHRVAELPGVLLSLGCTAVLIGLLSGLFLSFLLWLRQRGGALRFRSTIAAMACGSGTIVCTMLIPWWPLSLLCAVVLACISGMILSRRVKEQHFLGSGLAARFRRQSMTTGAVMVAFVAAGYLSACMSRSAVEQQLAREIAFDVYSGQPFNVKRGDADSERVFQAGGYQARRVPVGGSFFPWGEVKNSHVTYPFEVTADHGWVATPLRGGGARTNYFCLFGLVFRMGDESEWEA